ncbi:DUF5615 family PIN-like protein [Vineibacter terrae]|uniref:DUF5615 family PIN-like protein n=1 Tax=Vineibacter terrae TaxID=2586908 RepID=UPI0011C71D12
MKLLLDENLPPSLVRTVAGKFPDSTHVLQLGFGQTPDEAIYRFAGSNGFTIVSSRKTTILNSCRSNSELRRKSSC